VRPSRRTLRLLGALCAGASFLSCFEQPVTESLTLRFLPGDAVVVAVQVTLADEDLFKDNRAARERIESLRQDLLQGRDDWAKRLEAMNPAVQRTTLDWKEGTLMSATRRAVVTEPSALSPFFSSTLIQATVTRREKETEMTLAPAPGGRASRSQREDLASRMDLWLQSISRYLAAGKALYEYLEQNPARSASCLQEVFHGEARGEEEAPSLSEQEKSLTQSLRDAMDETLDLFTVPEEEAYSLEELSRLVYDPFPAPITLEVPGKILDSEGFMLAGAQVLKVPELSLWNSLAAESGRWISPDLLQLRLQSLKENRPIDLPALLHQPRKALPPPSPKELRQALEKRLQPAGLYRVRWNTEGLKALDPSHELEPLLSPPPASGE
jgi:hypothetical protein